MGFALLLEYWQHSYENTVHTFQISSQLAEKSKRYDTFQTKTACARGKSATGEGQGQFSRYDHDFFKCFSIPKASLFKCHLV